MIWKAALELALRRLLLCKGRQNTVNYQVPLPLPICPARTGWTTESAASACWGAQLESTVRLELLAQYGEGCEDLNAAERKQKAG